MPRNDKQIRFFKNRCGLQRAFVEPHPKIDVCATLLHLWITGSDKLSRANILFAEKHYQLFRDNVEFQKDPLFATKVEQLGAALRRAKDSLIRRNERRKERKEIEGQKAVRKAKNEPTPPPVESDPWNLI